MQASQVPLSLVSLSIYTLALELLFDHSLVHSLTKEKNRLFCSLHLHLYGVLMGLASLQSSSSMQILIYINPFAAVPG